MLDVIQTHKVGVLTKPGHSDIGLDLKNKVKDRVREVWE